MQRDTSVLSFLLGLYSQKVFRNQNWTNIESFAYADFKDENGEEYLKDTREHTHVMTFFQENNGEIEIHKSIKVQQKNFQKLF